MMPSLNLFIFLCLMLVLELSTGRVLTTHRETKIGSDGRKYTKVWTTYDDDEEPKSDDDSEHKPDFGDSMRAPSLFSEPSATDSRDPMGFSKGDDVEWLPSSFRGYQVPQRPDTTFAGRGMDPNAVQEVMRTKKPVVTTTTDPDGTTRTTTYKLEPDGSISMRTLLQRKPTITRHQWETKPLSYPWNNFGNDWQAPPKHYPSLWPSMDDDEPPFGSPEIPEEPPKPLARPSPKPSVKPTPTPTTTTTTTTTTQKTTKPTQFTTRTTATPKPTIASRSSTPLSPTTNYLKTTTPLPSLDDFLRTTTALPKLEDFLKMQYGKNLPSTTPKTPKTSNDDTTVKPVTTFKLEDLPVTAVINNGKPQTPEDFAKSQEKDDLRPEDVGLTRVRTLTKNVHTTKNPKIDDLEPDMQDMIRNAGITPEELESAQGDIVKTRTEPDGRVITTRYKVSKMPVIPDPPRIPPSFYHPDLSSSGSRAGVEFPMPHEVESMNPKVPEFPSNPKVPEFPSVYKQQNPWITHSMRPMRPRIRSPIADFLALLSLTSDDLLLNHGIYNKRIVDDDGRVLTMRLVLS